ncbi:helix-turn-helix domain-containing protein [Streptomyces alfalfae]|uniref:Helix-turn-helix transcriptional regulator n=1 Tax=Streptomyces alfalfae TaxID=1642299 RepID=A0A7T4TYB2_9ACTN|nr:helix-turn-helix transcriptional regulator [Streptomyces alfalfae]QQC89870.1 helix-turn-helix transcriptional regulator [Streptomyces alfalfae]
MKPNGPLIRAIRRGRKLSIRELQAKTGLDRGYLSRIEREQIHDIGDAQVRKVATALQVPEDLITDEEMT